MFPQVFCVEGRARVPAWTSSHLYGKATADVEMEEAAVGIRVGCVPLSWSVHVFTRCSVLGAYLSGSRREQACVGDGGIPHTATASSSAGNRLSRVSEDVMHQRKERLRLIKTYSF